MSSIPPNIIGSVIQAQLSAAETARKDDAQKNKRTQDARDLARLARQQTSAVENTEHTEDVVVRREDEKQRNGQDARDTYDAHAENESSKLYTPEGKTAESEKNDPPDQPPPPDHIDLSA